MTTDPDSDATQLPHLLVVDDSRLMRRAISKILGKEYRISEAADGEEGWRLLGELDDIRVVFSDLSMPNLDGFGLLERIRSSSSPAISELPVVIITGAEDDDETKHKALNAGASDFISKPFESVQLRTRAKTHVTLKDTNTKLNETESRLEEECTVDALTGLANRNYYDKRINQDLSYAKRHRGELTLIRLDINGFEKLFLKHGKESADAILKQVAGIARDNIRNEDTIARIGLARLAFILPSTNRVGARRLGERLCEQIGAIDIDNIPITTSIGVAAIDITPELSAEDILAVAERHLDMARSQPGSCVVIEAEQQTEAPGIPGLEEVIETEHASPAPPPLETLPGMDTAVQMAAGDETERLQPHLAALLKKLLPLLKLCNDKLALGIDDAIASIEQRLD